MNTPTAPDFGSTSHAATWLFAVTLFLSLHCVAADAPQVTSERNEGCSTSG